MLIVGRDGQLAAATLIAAGLIKQIGAKHPGVGKRKRYSGAALLKAVLLQALTDALGAPASGLVAEMAEYMAESAIDARGRFKDKGGKLWVIARRLGGKGFFFAELPPDQLLEYIADPECAIHLIIHLDRLLWQSGLQTGKDSGIDVDKEN